ncbi:hypothetical protein IV203_025047 [Nitzschia inconspicua]|uniref:Uncharacterized protein n=1 Tax=Nitzschia inconspicua TaxID=303405 RepID=A0A9K3K3Q8_9STRA|nr:hypothetical protein IV203_025047 [Nitzschia inconspicua]
MLLDFVLIHWGIPAELTSTEVIVPCAMGLGLPQDSFASTTCNERGNLLHNKAHFFRTRGIPVIYLAMELVPVEPQVLPILGVPMTIHRHKGQVMLFLLWHVHCDKQHRI